MSALLKLLVISGSDDEAATLRRFLEKAGYQITLAIVSSRAALERILDERAFDVILCDFDSPELDGFDALKLCRQLAENVPLVVLAEVLSEARVVEAMKAGARDYVSKNDLVRLAPVIERELRETMKRRVLSRRYLAFARLGQSLSSVTSPQEAARLITQVADELIGWDSCFLDVYTPSRDKFYHVFDVDVIDDEKREMKPDDWGTEMTPTLQKVIDHGAQLILRGQPEFDGEQLRPFGDKSRPSASIMIVPVRNGLQLLGFLSIQSYRPNAYTKDDVDTLQTLADYCGGALERIRLEKEILEISSREQRRIGQNLHDGLCQHLAGLAFHAQILADKLSEKAAPESADADKIVSLLNDAILQTRGIARGVFPVQLEENGLISALAELATNAERAFKICCRFQCAEPVLINDSAMAENLYYIAHEALMNAVKHGKARNVVMTLGKHGDHEVLSVRDDGVGIPEHLVESKGMGLHIMNYRARLIGGALEIKRDRDRGTVVSCTFTVLSK